MSRGRLQRAILGQLAAAEGGPLTIAQLAEGLGGAEPSRAALVALRRAVNTLAAAGAVERGVGGQAGMEKRSGLDGHAVAVCWLPGTIAKAACGIRIKGVFVERFGAPAKGGEVRAALLAAAVAGVASDEALCVRCPGMHRTMSGWACYALVRDEAAARVTDATSRSMFGDVRRRPWFDVAFHRAAWRLYDEGRIELRGTLRAGDRSRFGRIIYVRVLPCSDATLQGNVDERSAP